MKRALTVLAELALWFSNTGSCVDVTFFDVGGAHGGPAGGDGAGVTLECAEMVRTSAWMCGAGAIGLQSKVCASRK